MGGGADIVKEFEEVSERDRFLAKEMVDLEESIKSLQNLMADLKDKIDAEFKDGVKKINKELIKVGKEKLDIKLNVDAVLSLPITWIEIELFIINKATEYEYSIPGNDCMHLASMETFGVHEIISADEDFDKVSFITRIDPLKYK